MNAEQGFLDGVYTEAYITKFVNYHHCHKNKGFLKKKRKGKRFLYFDDYVLSFKQVESNYTVRKNPATKVVLLSFLIVWISDTINMVLLFFQFKFKMVVHAICMKKKICEVNNFGYVFNDCTLTHKDKNMWSEQVWILF